MTDEEMIENLKCVIADISEQCERLKSENTELRARLDKAVELKAKVYDTIYMPWVYDGESGVCNIQVCAVHFLIDGSVIYATDLDEELGEQERGFLSKYHYGNFSQEDFSLIVFTNKEEAEYRLAELKGEKE